MSVRGCRLTVTLVVCGGSLSAWEGACAPVTNATPTGDPYVLSGKRVVFTNWHYVHPGGFSWVNDAGEGVTRSAARRGRGTRISGAASTRTGFGCDRFRHPVTWKGESDLGFEAGNPVLLRFRLEKAAIYCLDFE
jgi:hypothetical protein